MRSSHSPQNGVMLLEALVAILLISFGILGLGGGPVPIKPHVSVGGTRRVSWRELVTR
jgi:hypothetical protein